METTEKQKQTQEQGSVTGYVHMGKNIENLRKNRNLTQDQIKDFLGLKNQQAVSRMEKKPKLDNNTVEKLAKFFNVPKEDITESTTIEEGKQSNFDNVVENEKCSVNNYIGGNHTNYSTSNSYNQPEHFMELHKEVVDLHKQEIEKLKTEIELLKNK